MKLKIKEFLKRHFSAMLIGLLLAAVFAVTCSMINAIRDGIGEFEMVNSPAAITVLGEAKPASVGDVYSVREYDGRIGVFIPGDTQPIRVIQVYVTYLPEADRAKLRKGIEVIGKRELAELIGELES